ncbi:MAG TPA: hypothetical protein VGO11_12720 [Chthoniobacteraceae bacterium]|jgi:hypothetical protein|nr:hypothetical protein [Chthoniobacteraceae bacterium]
MLITACATHAPSAHTAARTGGAAGPMHYAPHQSGQITSLSRTVYDEDDWSYIGSFHSAFFAGKSPDVILHFGPRCIADNYDSKAGEFNVFLPSNVQPLIVSTVRSTNRKLSFYFTAKGIHPTADQTSAYLK